MNLINIPEPNLNWFVNRLFCIDRKLKKWISRNRQPFRLCKNLSRNQMDFRLLNNIHWLHIDSSPRNDLNKEIFDILTPMRTRGLKYRKSWNDHKKILYTNKIGTHFWLSKFLISNRLDCLILGLLFSFYFLLWKCVGNIPCSWFSMINCIIF
jgi:hypothetical protein